LNPPELEKTVYDCIVEGKSAPDVITKTEVENLDMMPSNLNLARAEALLFQRMARERVLEKVLSPVKDSYDVMNCGAQVITMSTPSR
jgi:chromosome partitioning protein